MMHREKNEAEGEEPTGEQEVGDKGRQVDGWLKADRYGGVKM